MGDAMFADCLRALFVRGGTGGGCWWARVLATAANAGGGCWWRLCGRRRRRALVLAPATGDGGCWRAPVAAVPGQRSFVGQMLPFVGWRAPGLAMSFKLGSR